MSCQYCEGGVIEVYPNGEPTLVACEHCAGTGEDLDGEQLADATGYDLHPEGDDRDESPVEMTERTLEKWDFDSDPDWR
jgi:hypothetical protein